MTNSNPPQRTQVPAKPVAADDPLGGLDAQAILAVVYASPAQPIADTADWVRRGRLACDRAALRGF